YRYHHGVAVQVASVGRVTGDIAWGGNWFFLVDDHGQMLELANVETLTDFAWKIRQTLAGQGITGADGAAIDHIELFGPPHGPANHGRNFVLCPGKAYDRSPCGTGTSAKIACLIADGKLKPGDIWRQASVIGSQFEASFERDGDHILPPLRQRAHTSVEATLLMEAGHPCAWGLR